MDEFEKLLNQEKQINQPTPFKTEKIEVDDGNFESLLNAEKTAKAEGLNPQGIKQIKNASFEGFGIPSIQRVSSGFSLSPLGVTFDPIKYKASNPNTDIWDMIGDVITSVTSVIPGKNLAQTAVKSGIQAGVGAGSAALLSALGGAEGIAKVVEKYPALKPLLTAVQAGGAVMGMQSPKVKPLSDIGQTAQEMGIKGTQSAEAKLLGGDQKLIDREYEIKTKYPDVYEKYINQPRQEGLKKALKEIGGEATEMTSESTGATIKSNIKQTKKGLGEEFEQVEEKIKGVKNKEPLSIFHGSSEKNINNLKNNLKILTPEEKLKIESTGGGNIGLSTSTNKDIAAKYSMALGGKEPMELFISPDAKILKKDFKGMGIDEVYTGAELEKLQKQGYDAIQDTSKKAEGELRILKTDKIFLTKKILGNKVSSKVNDYLASQGVTSKRTGQEKIKDTATINLIKERAKLLENAKSTEDLLNQKRQFGNDIKAAFEKNKVTDANAKKAVYKIIDDAIYESIPDKKLAEEWRSVNDKWSELENQMEVVGNIKDIEPNKIFASKVLSQGPEAIESLKGLAGKQAVKDAGMQYLFYEATKNEAGRVNVDLIATKLKELKNKGMAEKIFGEDLAKLDKLVEVGKYVEAPLQPRVGMNKYGGSQTAFVNDFIKATEMTGWQKALKLVTDIWNKKRAESFAKAGPQQKTSGAMGIGGSIISGLGKGTKGSLKSLEERKK